MSNSVRPHRGQPTRLPRPWDSPGKNTGEGCHFLVQRMKVKSESEVAQSCPTLSDPMDCSLPGFFIHGVFQARVLEWGAIAFSESSIMQAKTTKPQQNWHSVRKTTIRHLIETRQNVVSTTIQNYLMYEETRPCITSSQEKRQSTEVDTSIIQLMQSTKILKQRL